MLRTISRLAGIAIFLASPFSSDATANTTPANAVAREIVEIPFSYVGNHLIAVQGSAGARENLTFLVDLGTTYTLIDRKIAAQLESSPSLAVSHFSGSLSANEAILPTLTIGPLQVSSFPVYLVDLTEMPVAPAGAAGIIGVDFLSQRNVTFDFASQKIVLSERVSGAHQTPIEKCAVGLAVQTSWKNQPVKLALSNGVDVVTLDRERMSEKPVKLRGLKAGALTTNFSVTPVSLFKTNDLVVNGIRLRGDGVLRKIDWPVATDQLDGFLPLAALRASRVSLDFQRGLLFWDSADDKIEKAQSGQRPAAANSLREK